MSSFFIVGSYWAKIVCSGHFSVSLDLFAYSAISTNNVKVQFAFPELKIEKTVDATVQANEINHIQSKILVNSSSVELWWPNGRGKQQLYELTVEAYCEGFLFGHFNNSFKRWSTVSRFAPINCCDWFALSLSCKIYEFVNLQIFRNKNNDEEFENRISMDWTNWRLC